MIGGALNLDAFKGTFQLPDVGVSCNYSYIDFPEIQCRVSKKISLNNAWSKWSGYENRTGFKYKSNLKLTQFGSSKKIDEAVSRELSKVTEDFLGTRDLVFHNKGNVTEFFRGFFYRIDYDIQSKQRQLENKEIIGIYEYPFLSFNCSYLSGKIQCSLMGDENKGYVPIYENDNEIIHETNKNRNLDYLRYTKIKLQTSNVNSNLNERDKITIITGFEYKTTFLQNRDRIRDFEENPRSPQEYQDELKFYVLSEFDLIMQIVLRYSPLNGENCLLLDDEDLMEFLHEKYTC